MRSLCVFVQLDDLKQFRQWDSCTPGHPENFETEGVEVTTGMDASLDDRERVRRLF